MVRFIVWKLGLHSVLTGPARDLVPMEGSDLRLVYKATSDAHRLSANGPLGEIPVHLICIVSSNGTGRENMFNVQNMSPMTQEN